METLVELCTVPACQGQVNLPLRGFAKTGAGERRETPSRLLRPTADSPLPRSLPSLSSASSILSPYSALIPLSGSLSAPLFLSPAVPLSFLPNPSPSLPPSLFSHIFPPLGPHHCPAHQCEEPGHLGIPGVQVLSSMHEVLAWLASLLVGVWPAPPSL